MEPLERAKLERRTDDMLKARNADVQSLALAAKKEIGGKNWGKALALTEQAEALWSSVKPSRVVDLLVRRGDAANPAGARRLIQAGRVKVNGVVLRRPFATAAPGDLVVVV